jgi:hypothetical protein
MVRRSNASIFLIGGLAFTAMAVAEPTWYVVTDNDVQVRCGADSSYYSFATAQEGDLVAVTGEKYNYARIQAVGNVFDEAYGYVKYPASEEGRFNLSDDGRMGQTLGATPVLAPNLNTNDLAHSWRQLCILPRGMDLQVIETWIAETDGLHAVPHTVHRVVLPVNAEGWMNMADLRPAMASELNPPTMAPTETVVEVEAMEEDVIVIEEVEVRVDESSRTIVESGETPILFIETDEPSLLMRWVEAESTEDVSALTEEPVEIIIEQETLLMMIENAYEGVNLSDLDEEELACLRDDFLMAGEEEEDPIRARYARMRADQIDVYTTLRDQNEVISALHTRIERSRIDAVDREVAIANTGDYEVVGLLSTSAVFNGTNRPMLYRIQDSKTSRTLAYMRPESLAFVDMVGQHIGVMGHLEYDPILQVNIISMSRVDLMASNTAFVPVD